MTGLEFSLIVAYALGICVAFGYRVLWREAVRRWNRDVKEYKEFLQSANTDYENLHAYCDDLSRDNIALYKIIDEVESIADRLDEDEVTTVGLKDLCKEARELLPKVPEPKEPDMVTQRESNVLPKVTRIPPMPKVKPPKE